MKGQPKLCSTTSLLTSMVEKAVLMGGDVCSTVEPHNSTQIFSAVAPVISKYGVSHCETSLEFLNVGTYHFPA